MAHDMKIAVICSSNQNRSMEAHAFLSKKGFKVRSFGTGDKVKLPGSAPDKPNIYEFGVSYEEMYQDLLSKDKNLYPLIIFSDDFIVINKMVKTILVITQTCTTLAAATAQKLPKIPLTTLIRYTQNGILHMLDRNRRIKTTPERFQHSKERFDVVVTCEERVFDQVIEDLESRFPQDNTPVHVINLDIQDNHEEATIGAFLICELLTVMSQSEDLDNDIDEIILEFESKTDRTILHTVQFY